MDCTLCGKPLIERIDKEYYSCSTCFGLVKDPSLYLSPKAERAHYELHNNDVNDLRYQQFVSPITAYVQENFQPYHRGLDYGSGTGPVISKVLHDKLFQLDQYDPYFESKTEVFQKRYDFIVCCEVMEHFYQPALEFERLKGLLKNRGSLICMTLIYEDTIDFESWYYRKDPTHVFIYRRKTLEFIAQKFDLKLAHSTRQLIVFKKSS